MIKCASHVVESMIFDSGKKVKMKIFYFNKKKCIWDLSFIHHIFDDLCVHVGLLVTMWCKF